MKKLLTIAALFILVLALTACSDSPAPLITPHVPDTVQDDYDTNDYDEYHYEEYHNDDSTLESDTDYEGDYESDFILDDNPWDNMPVFGSMTGTVVRIATQYTDPPSYAFYLEGESGSAVLITDFNTFFLGEIPEVGDTITGFHLMTTFMRAIYPPQYDVSVIVNGDFENIAVDRFDDELISYDGNLRLNIGEDTEIILQDGELFDCELAHRKLVVLFDISTRSIPAQTTPNKIIVLFEQFTTGPAFL
ncbi:MAG: hypothetical protein FWC92_07750 [Defluviitaleaceae bacterium]|nr:hypothetical protein [Defluviitaleaceae bacterium]